MTTDMKKIIILGMNGFCFEILDMLEAINAKAGRIVYQCAGYLDDDPAKIGRTFDGGPVLGPIDTAAKYGDCRFVNVIGNPSNFRRKDVILARTGLAPERFETLVHPAATVSPQAKLGHGVIVSPYSYIPAGAEIGDLTCILSGCVFGHETTVGAYGSVAACAAVSGRVRIGRLCYLGANCSIVGDIDIGDRVMIGMGAVVLKSVESGLTMVGNPAHVLVPRNPA